MRITILISLLSLIVCKLPDNEISVNQTKHVISIDTSRYTIIKFDSSTDADLFDSGAKPSILSNEEIVRIEALVDKKVTEYNKSKKKGIYPLVINHPEKYYKQFIAVTNPIGEKEVWVNCFCSIHNMSSWRKYKVRVMDGGSCYFQLKINLTKNIVYDFGVNGVA